MNGSARFHRRTPTQSATITKKNGKLYTILLSCCLFLSILCACLLTALVLIGKHLYLNKSDVILVEEVTTVSSSNSNLSFRLPNDTIPIHYNLTFKPYLETGKFEGEINITLEVKRPRRTLIVHNKNLTIDRIDLFSVNNSKRIAVENVDINKELEIFTVFPKDELILGTYFLHLTFRGNMLNKLVGFYKSVYKDEQTNGTRPIATSKFEPTYARQAFPCFDEPNMKAKYTVHILRPATPGYIALSNMPQKGETPVENGVLVHFEESKRMSTYLSCFIVCDFVSNNGFIKPDIGEPIPLRVFSTPAQINKTAFALDVGASVMEYFVKYFGIPYPLPKLDLIAIPDFVSGAMEHWGLVTFRETALLFDENISSSQNKQRVASVIAHELAHSWFGNLVTMNWWNDLWLNEGFAAYIEYKGVDFKFKDWQMKDQFLINTLHSVMSTDATPASHPIVQSVVTPDQITEIFDAITYSKGSSILRMLDHALTEEVFQMGVKNYLIAHKWGNAVTQDLWNELQKLVPDTINITNIMGTWTVQMGYPIVSVLQKDNNYILTQKRFLKDYSSPGSNPSVYGYKWSIPITYVTDQNPIRPTTVWFNYDQPQLQIVKQTGIKWIKFNHNQVGYYRVNYSPEFWNTLAENINAMSISDKTHLLEESFSIAESGDLSYSIPLQLTKYLETEYNYIPWSVASAKLGSLKKYLIDTMDFAQYSMYMLGLVQSAYETIGWMEQPEDSHLTRRARTIFLNFACANGHTDCLEIGKTKFISWLKDPNNNQISQDLRGLVYYYGMQNSGKEEWFDLLKLFKQEIDANEKLNMLHALSAVKETWLLHHLIQLGTIEGKEQIIRGQDYFTMLQYISENPIGTPIVWNYVRENWTYLVDRFGTNDRYLGRLIPGITKSFTTSTKLKEMESFFVAYPNAGAGKGAREQALAHVKNNIKWISTNRVDVINWLRTHNSSSK